MEKLTVVIPVYNEADNIVTELDAVIDSSSEVKSTLATKSTSLILVPSPIAKLIAFWSALDELIALFDANEKLPTLATATEEALTTKYSL